MTGVKARVGGLGLLDQATRRSILLRPSAVWADEDATAGGGFVGGRWITEGGDYLVTEGGDYINFL